MNLSRRELIAQFGAVGTVNSAYIASAGAASATVPESPQIQLDAPLNLDREDIYKFLWKGDDGSELGIEPILTPAETLRYREAARKPAGVQSLPDTTLPYCKLVRAKNAPHCDPLTQGVFVAIRLRYAVRQNKATVGEVDALVLREYAVIVTAYNVLLIDKGLPTASEAYTQIAKGFDEYQFVRGKSPHPAEHAITRMGDKGKGDEFLVRTAFVIKKVHLLNEYADQNNYLESFSQGKADVHFADTRRYESLERYLKLENCELYRVKDEELVGRVPPPQFDSVNARELPVSSSVAAEDSTADAVFKTLSVFAPCDNKTFTRERIATILGWPEFRIVMQDVKIQLGCIWVIFSIPVPQVRFSGLVLYAGAIHEPVSRSAEAELEGCIYHAAFSSAVVGVALGNLAAALTAFKALLYSCLAQKGICAVPELVVLVESSSWS